MFPNSKVIRLARYGEAGPGPKGSVMTVEFELAGQRFIALNGGPQFKFTEAISFSVDCKPQQELDAFWEKLSVGGELGPCGWLKDKYGLSWQIVPNDIEKMIEDKDTKKSDRVLQAVWSMVKLDIAALKRAYKGS